jgi:uncharacterized protein YuzE
MGVKVCRFFMIAKPIYYTFASMNENSRSLTKRLSEDIVLDVGEDDKIVGIEIIDASKQLNLETLLPLHYEMASLRHHHG